MIKSKLLLSVALLGTSTHAFALGPCSQEATTFCSGQGYSYCYEAGGNECCSNQSEDPGCVEASQVYEVTRRTRIMVPSKLPIQTKTLSTSK